MLLGTLVSGKAPAFHDVRTYWSPDVVKRVTGKELEGRAKDGIIHLINSGATALDCTGAAKDENGNGTIKEWWNMSEEDINSCIEATDWCRADYEYFRGGFSSHFKTQAEMPVTMHNVEEDKVYRPHAWSAFGTEDAQAAEYAACKHYGPCLTERKRQLHSVMMTE